MIAALSGVLYNTYDYSSLAVLFQFTGSECGAAVGESTGLNSSKKAPVSNAFTCQKITTKAVQCLNKDADGGFQFKVRP